jgi:hypothetical protein
MKIAFKLVKASCSILKGKIIDDIIAF